MSKRKWIAFTVIGMLLCIAFAITYLTFKLKIYDYSHLVPRGNQEVTEGFEPLTVASKGVKPKDMALAARTETLELYINEETANIAVVDTRNNEVWYGTPENMQEDALANNREKINMASPVTIRYYDSKRKSLQFMSYDECIERGQYTIDRIENGVRVTYTFGDMSLGADAIPTYFTKERLEEMILSKLDDSTASYVQKRYVPSRNKEGFLEVIESVRTSTINLKRMLQALEDAGYTEENLHEENEIAGIEMDLTREFIIIPVDYQVIDDSLSVTIPMEEVEESDGITLAQVELLKYFGSGSVEEEGYLLVPAGSGGLIEFNNGKLNEDSYMQVVYGTDPLLWRLRPQVMQNAKMPVFGIKKDNGGFIANIESGDALANVSAEISGRKSSYNLVYPSFNLRISDTHEMAGVSGSESDMTVIQKNTFEGDVVVQYSFLAGNDITYSDMAMRYREELINRGTLAKKQQNEELNFYTTVLGSVEKVKHIVGIRYDSFETMTTYEEAMQILDELTKEGISNVQMRYLGWFNNGVNHDVAKKINLTKSVGSKKEMNALEDALKEQGGNLFMDVQLQQVPYKGKNYNTFQETARDVAGYTATNADFNRAMLNRRVKFIDAVYNINSVRVLPFQLDKFLKAFDKLPVDGISLRDLGSFLSSDQRKKATIDRESAKLIVVEQLEKIKRTGAETMVAEGNIYSVPYADHLINIADSGDQYYLVDQEIPFYHMVLHGSVAYSGSPINVMDVYDKEAIILRHLEYGMQPHFIFTYEETSKLNNTTSEKYYSTNYKQWLGVAKEVYDTINSVYKEVANSQMVGHKEIAPKVYETTYDNGVLVYVNYNDSAYTKGQLKIEGRSHVVGGVR